MDIKTVTASPHDAIKKHVSDDNTVDNKGVNLAKESVTVPKTSLSASSDSMSLSVQSLHLAKVTTIKTEQQPYPIESQQQAKKVVQDLVNNIQDNPAQALAAFGNASSGRLGSVLA